MGGANGGWHSGQWQVRGGVLPTPLPPDNRALGAAAEWLGAERYTAGDGDNRIPSSWLDVDKEGPLTLTL